jgi:hypothetical protein
LGKELSARVEFLSGILPPLCGPQLWTREESFPNARVSSLTSDGIFGVGLSSDRKRTLRTGEQAAFCVGSHWILTVGPCCAGLFFGIASFTEWLAARSPISAKDGSAHGYFVLALVAFTVAWLCVFGRLAQVPVIVLDTHERAGNRPARVSASSKL